MRRGYHPGEPSAGFARFPRGVRDDGANRGLSGDGAPRAEVCEAFAMSSRPFVVLVAGEPIARVRTVRGSYANMIRTAGREPPSAEWRDVDLRDGSPLPDPSAIAGVVVTGSSASVTERAPWMLRVEEYLRTLVERRVPTFGICFGHQLLGQALGGEVVKNPLGREIGTVELDVVGEDPLIDGAPPRFTVNATHVDTVFTLPPGARLLARTEREPHAMVRFGEAAWGVQFHPEMDAEVVRNYLAERRDVVAREGLDPDRLLAAAGDADAGRAVLVRFLERARAQTF